MKKQDISPEVLKLLESVKTCFELHPPEDLKPVERERLQLSVALAAVCRFFSALQHRDSAEAFFQLSYSLDDLNRGAQPRLLTRSKKRAPNSTDIEIGKAHIAFALEALIMLGQTPQGAARELLRKYPKIIKLGAGKSRNPRRTTSDDVRTILRWRHNLRAPSRQHNEQGKTFFDMGCDFIGGMLEKGDRQKVREQAFGRAAAALKMIVS